MPAAAATVLAEALSTLLPVADGSYVGRLAAPAVIMSDISMDVENAPMRKRCKGLIVIYWFIGLSYVLNGFGRFFSWGCSRMLIEILFESQLLLYCVNHCTLQPDAY